MKRPTLSENLRPRLSVVVSEPVRQRVRQTPESACEQPYVCPYCSIPTSKPKGHYACRERVTRRWRYALSREQREFGRDVGKALAEQLCL